MSSVPPLDPSILRWRCDPQQFGFQTTDELEELSEILGQQRALGAVQFGTGIRRDGYNLYAMGPSGVGKRTMVRQLLEGRAVKEEKPSDWCYVHNFDQPRKPRAVRLPAGRGVELRDDMERLVDDLRTAIPAALEMEEYHRRLEEIQGESNERQEKAMQDLAEKAEAEGMRLIRTPAGFAMAPAKDDKVLSPEEFSKLPEEERKRIVSAIEALQERLQQILKEVPRWQKDARDKIRDLNRDTARFSVEHSIGELKKKYHDLAEVQEYLDEVASDAIDHADEFRATDDEKSNLFAFVQPERSSLNRFKVNLLVDNREAEGAPVVFEDHPTFQNLVGRAEHEARLGALLTDFSLIRSGALHRANGGYLILEALRLLQQPFAWEALKRVLHARQVRTESLGESLSMVSTVTLEPEPIPLDVKVILLGDRMLYYLLYQYDQDFPELFKVAADFEERMDRSAECCDLYARFIATLARREQYLPLDRGAVARVIEHGTRLSEDSEKLSLHMRSLADVLREADHWARDGQAETISADHVQRAIDQQIYRSDRVREQVHEEIHRGTILIATEGAKVAQVNGLSVLGLGNFSFGQPSRITATARIGKGEVVDIEREAKLGGAIHSKGVMILSSFLAARYSSDMPLSLSASLVFEQSYGMVEGDSASVAETCALLSALSGIPIKQNLAVTGSMNQLGQVQPIGGVNQKIEGFFDVCRARKLTGEQGVLIPASNVKHLMLRQDVVDAVREGKFHVYAVDTIDQAVSLLTGVEAGELDAEGGCPPGTVNYRVQARLVALSEQMRKFVKEEPQEGQADE